jgi:hypothetical protein
MVLCGEITNVAGPTRRSYIKKIEIGACTEDKDTMVPISLRFRNKNSRINVSQTEARPLENHQGRIFKDWGFPLTTIPTSSTTSERFATLNALVDPAGLGVCRAC